MRAAIIGVRWPDVDLELGILGLAEDEIVRDPGATREDLLTAASKAEVILAGPRPRFDASTIEGLSCRGIVRYGVGYDNIDVAAAHRKGMAVAYVPDYGTEAVALHAVSLALVLLRRIPQADHQMKAGEWGLESLGPLHLPSVLTAGVVGFGRIGRRTTGHFIALGFGNVLAHDEVEVSAPGVGPASLEALFAACDVISIHASGAPGGTPIVGPAEIALMRPGSILVNTSRGSLVDTEALLGGLRIGRPTAAALDVFDEEPPDPDRFADVADRIIMTPHMAWYTEETELELRTKTAEEARRILDGEPVVHTVPSTEVSP